MTDRGEPVRRGARVLLLDPDSELSGQRFASPMDLPWHHEPAPI